MYFKNTDTKIVPIFACFPIFVRRIHYYNLYNTISPIYIVNTLRNNLVSSALIYGCIYQLIFELISISKLKLTTVVTLINYTFIYHSPTIKGQFCHPHLINTCLGLFDTRVEMNLKQYYLNIFIRYPFNLFEVLFNVLVKHHALIYCLSACY